MEGSISAGLRARVALDKYAFRHTHALGQNFILDDAFIGQMLDEIGLTEADNVLEIGPGAGVMTDALSRRCRRVLAIEVDRSLREVLDEVLAGCENVRVVYQDVMKTNLVEITDEAFAGEPFRVVANLPYYITTDVIIRLLTSNLPIREIAVMVQREAAERMLALPGEKQWCATAATVQYFGVPEIVLDVPRELFSPPPHVESCCLRISIPEERPVHPRSEETFLKLISAAFAMRRKTLANNLKAAFSLSQEAALTAIRSVGLDDKVRGEALTLEELAQLSNVLAAD